MSNMIHYVNTFTKSFKEHPFSTVDSLVLSQLSYVNFKSVVPNDVRDGLTLGDISKIGIKDEFFLDTWNVKLNKDLLVGMVNNPRFDKIEICFIHDKISEIVEEQFHAMTYIIDESVAYIAFRGTDTTIVGWKEDFNMAFTYPVPSQEDALKYFYKIYKQFDGEFYLGGHSKGGNLATYVTINAEKDAFNRIIKSFSHDGPGFKEGVLEKENVESLLMKVEKTVPESSIVGLLLENHEELTIVKSKGLGPLQHNPYYWVVEEGSLIEVHKLSSLSRNANLIMKNWLDTKTNDERERFAETIFSVFEAGDIKSFREIDADVFNKLKLITEAVKNTDEDSKKFIKDSIKSFIDLALQINPFENNEKER